MGKILEQATQKFLTIRNSIDSKEHPRAYRVLHFISWKLLLQDNRNAEDIAKDIVENIAFWEWCNKQYPMTGTIDIIILRDVFNAMDDEDKTVE